MSRQLLPLMLGLGMVASASAVFYYVPSSISVAQYSTSDHKIWENVEAFCDVIDSCAVQTCSDCWTWTGWGDSQLVLHCHPYTKWVNCHRNVRCNICWSVSGSGFYGSGLNMYAARCLPYIDSCRGPASWTEMDVYCSANGYISSETVHTTVSIYTVPDCLQPSQIGIVAHASETTHYSYADVVKCDWSSGYVGRPTVDRIMCNVDATWDYVWGCTDMCNGEFNCWPGTCENGKVVGCTCSEGYARTDAITCDQVTYHPTFLSCHTEVTGPNGELKASSSSTHVCRQQSPMYGNFIATGFNYNLMAFFDPGSSYFPSTRPYYVDTWRFGVTDVDIEVYKYNSGGSKSLIDSRNILIDHSYNGIDANQYFGDEGSISGFNVQLTKHERLCLEFHAYGGGYLLTTESSQVKPYYKKMQMEMVCYLYDATPPVCDAVPLALEYRISQTPNINVNWEGWEDPTYSDGESVYRSGIESYTVIVNEVLVSHHVLMVDTAIVFSQTLRPTDDGMRLEFSTSSPKLFCVTLEVKDVADNVRKARRFFLYDVTTEISTSTVEPFYISSAVMDTSYLWQTNKNDICADWKNHFYNHFYMQNNLLGEIEPDSHGFFSGIYEQIDGVLPVSGTANVHGIIKFMFSYSKNGSPFSSEIEVPNFQSQAYCKRLNSIDADTFTIRIRAIDIAGNSNAQDRNVSIDTSAPHIENIGLVNGGSRQLTVHDATDLSRMDLQFDAYDPHSGINTVEWEFGESDGGEVFDNGAIGVILIDRYESINNTQCYCPAVGNICEQQRYSVPLHGLVSKFKHLGNHNRKYFFKITVKNNAYLVTTERMDVLVDASSPEIGVVMEGLEGYPDIDYTSEDTFLVHWHGFFDHESDVRMYRLGLADRCLSQEEVYTANVSDAIFANVSFPENSHEFTANFTGTRYTSVVALNHAMAPSVVVCSDGISRDILPPEIANLSIGHAKWSESIYCHDNVTWLLRYDLKKVRLPYPMPCSNSTSTSSPLAEAISMTADYSSKQHSEYENSSLPAYDSKKIIYLLHDRIDMKWDVIDDVSQIHEFSVGFGRTLSEQDMPGIVDYISTKRKTFFKLRHAGIGSDELFYMFLKAVNKAGLETVIPIGPLLIDQTAPRFRSIPRVIIDEGHVIVGWDNDTFFDDEQTEPVDRVTFQIGHDDMLISPQMEWRLGHSEPCDFFSGGCFRYSLSELQRQDTDLGLLFYFFIHVYNIAGHRITLQTDTFTLPSKYPPARAIVIDLDPDDDPYARILTDNMDMDDIDAHLAAGVVCAMWNEFTHHEDVQLEFGIGTISGQDDIYPFTHMSATNMYCVTSQDIPDASKVFVSIRANCSGGATISSSDGVVVYNASKVLEQLEVLRGPECFKPQHLIARMAFIPGENLTFIHALPAGNVFTLRIVGENISDSDIDLLKLQVYFKLINSNPNHIDITFQPYSDMQELTLPTLTNENASVLAAEVYDCEDDLSIQLTRNHLEAHWNHLPDDFTYEVAAFEVDCSNNSTDSCWEHISSYEALNESSAVMAGLNLQPQNVYYVGIRPCLYGKCLETKMSAGVYIESTYYKINITHTSLSLTSSEYVDVLIEWETLYQVNVSFYQWTVAAKVGTSKTSSPVLPWATVEEEISEILEVQSCVHLPVHAFKGMLGCIRAVSPSGQKLQSCKELIHDSSFNAYRTTVYDLDARSSSWDYIKTVIQSLYVGDAVSLLHNEEVDFGTKEFDMVGAVLTRSGRRIRWYLVTTPNVPDKCKSPNCKASARTTNGYVRFRSGRIRVNTIYYICAKAAEFQTTGETYSEVLPAFETCSNGFILDEDPPVDGEILINDVDGYINDLKNFDIMWGSFDDNADVEALGYVNKINSYTVSIGSSRYGSDIKSYTVDGNTNYVLIQDLVLDSGTTLFVSVTASDHAGLNTTVTSDRLTVDLTPPTVGHIVSSSLLMSKWLGGTALCVRANDFSDEESGVDHYVVSIGSSQHKMDIIPETTYTNEIMELSLEGASVIDGHTYYLGVKAVNRAGLSSNYAFLEFTIDHSPPTGGHVMDGESPEGKDIDYQAATTSLTGRWKGFTDPQSEILYYKVGLGTQPLETDVEPMINIGLNTDITWNSAFMPGETYYITVEACNGVFLCQSMSSDGILLDDSPPIPGLVKVGSNSDHMTFIPHTSFIEIFWTGFEDPQSGIGYYEACIGTSPGYCDIAPEFGCLLGSSHIQGELDLPVNKTLFVTVTGYNRNNKGVSKSSRHFIVDTSPPELVIRPTFVTNDTVFDGSEIQWEKSIMKIIWGFSDSESRVVRHIITLKTHHEGHTPIEHMELGQENEVTINLNGSNWLHNGDTYTVVVTACNAADLCTTAESDPLFIDSTPPHVGGFMPPLKWQNYIDENNETISIVDTIWYGFRDQESGIKKYYVGIGRTFTDNELSNGLVEFNAVQSESDYEEEVKLKEWISDGDKIVASIVAENNAGLISPIGRVTLIAVSSSPNAPEASDFGTLEIEKHSCDIHFCNKDCTCAIFGQVCADVETNMTCNVITDTEGNAFNVVVRVYTGIEEKPQNMTASSACIPAYWLVDDGLTNIKRFEWTLGILGEPYGEGVFDLSDESPWMDVGKFQHAVYCLPLNKSLHHGTEYLVYVRVWVTMDTYLIFQSDPILVDHTSPAIRKGKFIKDSDAECKNDFDNIDWVDKITGCWNSVFYEIHGQIIYYLVGLGTRPGADDVIYQTNVGLETRLEASGLNVTAGQHYYFTVIAYNNLGLRTVLSSDGFLADLDGPIAGVVYNTDRNRNYAFQSATDTFDVTWHGFIDPESGVKAYYVALFEDNESPVSVQSFDNVLFKTSVRLTNLSLEHGKKYYGAAKAVNTGDLFSAVILSQVKLIDTTPPSAYNCLNLSVLYETQTNLTKSGCLIFPAMFDSASVYIITGQLDRSNPDAQIKLHIGKSTGTFLPVELAHDGVLRFSYRFQPGIEGIQDVTVETDTLTTVNITMTLSKCTMSYRDEFSDVFEITQLSGDRFKASLPVVDLESGIKKTLFGFGSYPSGFQLKSLYPVDASSDKTFSLSVPHGSPFYGTAVVENFAGLRSVFHSSKIVVDHTPPVIEDLLVTANTQRSNNTSADNMLMMRLNVSWSSRDEESGIKMCCISIGTVAYRDNLQKYETSDDSYVFMTQWFHVSHGDKIYANIKCVNNVEYPTVNVSDPILVSVEEPVADRAQLRFIPRSRLSTEYSESLVSDATPDTAIQCNTTGVHFSWEGFTDITGIASYEYRLLSNNVTITDWINSGTKNTISYNSSNLEDGTRYTAEVCAVNAGNLRSDSITASILVDSRARDLTGEPLDVVANHTDRIITLDWQRVFATNMEIPSYYNVFVGSNSGFADIMEALYLTSNTLSFPVASTAILTGQLDELYIAITSVYATGERTTYHTTHRLPF